MADFDSTMIESIKILKNLDDLDWYKYRHFKPEYITEK